MSEKMGKSRVSVKGVAHGLRFEVVETPMGHRCGYVEVPLHMDIHGREDYMSEEYPNFDVHGGVTFVGYRISSEGLIAGETWWIGFDCSHSCDAPDFKLMDEEYKNALLPMLGKLWQRGIVRSEAYVVEQCKELARQLVEEV